MHPKLRDLSILAEATRDVFRLVAEEKKRDRPWAQVAAEAERLSQRLAALEKSIEDGT